MGFVLCGGDKGLLLLLTGGCLLCIDGLNDTDGAFGESTALGFEGAKGKRRVGTRIPDDANIAVVELTESLILCGLPVGDGHWSDTNVGFILFWHGDGDYRYYRRYRSV